MQQFANSTFFEMVLLFLLCQEGKSNRLWIELKVVVATCVVPPTGEAGFCGFAGIVLQK